MHKKIQIPGHVALRFGFFLFGAKHLSELVVGVSLKLGN
jgi:hypothetical protein